MWNYVIPIIIGFTIAMIIGGIAITLMDIVTDWIRTRLSTKAAHKRLYDLEEQIRLAQRHLDTLQNQ